MPALLVEKTDLADLFPNLFRIALIGLLIPTSTADCEIGFSALKRIKTPLRNRLSNPICVNLLFISIEGPTHDLLSMGIQKKQKNRHFKVTSDSRTVIHVHISIYTQNDVFIQICAMRHACGCHKVNTSQGGALGFPLAFPPRITSLSTSGV